MVVVINRTVLRLALTDVAKVGEKVIRMGGDCSHRYKMSPPKIPDCARCDLDTDISTIFAIVLIFASMSIVSMLHGQHRQA
jgi:hypothetical protein